jgi:hypothetical protein
MYIRPITVPDFHAKCTFQSAQHLVSKLEIMGRLTDIYNLSLSPVVVTQW